MRERLQRTRGGACPPSECRLDRAYADSRCSRLASGLAVYTLHGSGRWVACSAVVAGVMAAAAVWISDGSGSHPLTVSEIAAREAVAVAKADRFVVRSTTSMPNTSSSVPCDSDSCQTTVWGDVATGRLRMVDYNSEGQPVAEETERYLANGRVVITGDVSYQSRTQVSYNPPLPEGQWAFRSGSSPLSPAEKSVLNVTYLFPGLPNVAMAVGFSTLDGRLLGDSRAWVYRLAGRQDINGQPTFELEAPYPGPNTEPPVWRVYWWISEATYLPVRKQERLGTRPADFNIDFDWLPPTGAHLALLGLNVPTGFKHVLLTCRPYVPPTPPVGLTPPAMKCSRAH